MNDPKPGYVSSWKYNFPYPFPTNAAVTDFTGGTIGYHRCMAVVTALRDGGFPMPEDDLKAAQSVVFLLQQAAIR